jgi:hypothetical protein
LEGGGGVVSGNEEERWHFVWMGEMFLNLSKQLETISNGKILECFNSESFKTFLYF